MGLDQYLYAEKYYSPYNKTDKRYEDFNKIVELVEATDIIEPDYPSALVRVKVAQWRKANQIHKWFVDACQGGEDDCRDAYVELSSLQSLKKVCKQVVENPSIAEDYLPTQSGFFFGGEEYDEYYLEQLQDTISVIEKLEAMGNEWSFVYSSSW